MAKATGVVRKLDSLGRIGIPRETLIKMNMGHGEPLEIFVEDDGRIVLKKFIRGCIICNEGIELKEFKGKLICKSCMVDVENARSV